MSGEKKKKKFIPDIRKDKPFPGAAFCKNYGVITFKSLMNNIVGNIFNCPLPESQGCRTASNSERPCF